MAKYGKWIGAGLGFVMGGPIGALFGYFIGSTFDTATMVTSAPEVVEAMLPYFSEYYGNPSSIYAIRDTFGLYSLSTLAYAVL